MWELALYYSEIYRGQSFNVCEPSFGTGRFFKYAPSGANLYGFDTDKKNFDITRMLYFNAHLFNVEFETAFLLQPNFNKAIKKSWLPEMDIVIGNPPYGDYMGYYKTYMPKVFKRFEFLFIYLGLKLLKKDGLLLYVISQNFMNNAGTYKNMKEEILKIGEFVNAFRLPNGIFSNTEVGTDIVIFRKR